MKLVSWVRTFLAFVFRRSRVEHEMEEELRSHLKSRADDLERQGLPRAEAERQARVEFGGYERYKEECREALGSRLVGDLAADVRYGLRMLRRNPGFTAVAVVTLALGISVNTTLFTAIDGLLLRPPANVEAPDRLLTLYQTQPNERGGGSMSVWSYPDYVYYRDRSDAFTGLSAYSPIPVNLGVGGSNDRTFGDLVSGNYFAVRGTKAVLGRTFAAEDDTLGAPSVAVLSYELWQSRFGGDRGVVGKAITINGRLFTVIGVAPKGATDIGIQTAPAVWVALSAQPEVDWPPGEADALKNRGTGWLTVLGRLKPGITPRLAIAGLRVVARGLEQDYPAQERGRSISVEPAVALPSFMSGPVTGIVVLLGALGGMLLLIPCANVASLMLARSWSRRSEMAIRSALGASRLRTLRQLLTESMLMALCSAAAGLVLALWGAAALPHLKTPISLPIAIDFRPDIRVLGFTTLLAFVTALLFGTAPALQLSRAVLSPQLGGRTGSDVRRRSRAQRLLVSAQVSISLLLLIGAGLCLRSLHSAERIDPGFETRDVLSFAVSPSLSGYTNAQADVLYEQLLERLRATPGVRSASLAALMPLSYGGLEEVVSSSGTAVAGQRVQVGENLVTPGYCRTLGIPILRGRDFVGGVIDQDTVVVNQTLANRFFPQQNPVGQQLEVGGGQHPRSVLIIGVARDSKYRTLGESPTPFLYGLFRPGFEGPAGTTVLVRTSGAPQMLIPEIRRQVQELDKNLPVTGMETMAEHIRSALWLARTLGAFFAILGAAGTLLAIVGLSGSVAYSVARRTNEVGIRMALGAQERDVLRLVVGEGLFLTLSGIGAGLVLAFLFTRFLRSLLYGVSPTDPLALSAVSILFMLAALAVCYIPARRATKVDPMAALRHE